MNGVVAYALAKNIAASAVSGVKNYSVDGTTLKIETNDGNVLEMVFPVPTGIDKGYYNDENGKFYRDSEFENEITGKTDVVYIDHGQNRLCFWDGTEFTTTKKNALEFTAEEKAKLERLRNYDDSVLSGKINNIEKVIPTNASSNNKLATIADVENKNDGTTNYNDLENKPKIAGVELSGNKSLTDLGIQPAITGKGLSTEDFTTEEKTKLSSLSNYNDSSIKNELTNIKNVIPSNANSENKLATLADIPSGGSGNEGGTTNYSELTNKPQIAGVTLSGNKTLSDLGIQGVERGKGLSTNDYTNEEKAKLAGLSNYDDTSLSNRVTDVESNKVDKVEGKGLSANDYTDKEKTKLAGLSNYDDTSISNRVSNLEGIVPNSASSSNKLATLEDIPSGPNGTTNYNSLENKPQIAGTELSGNKTLSELGIQPAEQGKGLSTEDYTTEEKSKLNSLSNYDDTALAGRITDIEEIIPSTASEENKLATIEDIPEISEDNTDYNTLTEIITKDADQSNIVEVGGIYTLGGGAKNSEDNDIQVKCLSVDNATNTAIMQTYGITTEAQPNNIDLSEHYSSYWGELSSIISNVKLPNNGEHDNTISPNGAKEVLLSIKKSCWLARSRCVFDPSDHVYIYDVDKEFVCAPYFTLDLSKIIINNGTIELSSYKANITDLVTKIETKLNNRYTKSEVDNFINDKVDKVSGKGLSTEDYTTEDKEKLAGLTNYDDSELDTRVSSIEEVMPTSATPSNPLATLADIPSNVSGGSSTPTNYATLTNKPQIAGIELTGNKTLANLGIQPSEEGKGLSTNDFSDEEKSKLAGLSNYDDTALDNRVSNVENALSDKVDKDGSKGLSTNDFTTEEKNKLAELNNYDDTALSGRVTNIENIIPSTVSEENKLATIADIPTGEGNESSNTFNTADFDITEQGEVSLKPSQRAWIGTREEWDALSTEEKAKYGGIISITDDPNELDNKVDKIEGKGLSTNDYTNEEKTKLAGLNNYDDTEINNRVQELEDIIPESVNNENKLATIKDINDIPVITSSDIDRLWEMTFEDGDEEEY